VTVDGARLTSWQPITGRARIEFGGAVMLAECSVPAVSVPESIDLDPTRRPGRAEPGRSPAATTSGPRCTSARQQGQPGGHGQRRPVPLHAAPTTISEMPEGMVGPFGGPPPMPPDPGCRRRRSCRRRSR
jgi:hypothetical protein